MNCPKCNSKNVDIVRMHEKKGTLYIEQKCNDCRNRYVWQKRITYDLESEELILKLETINRTLTSNKKKKKTPEQTLKEKELIKKMKLERSLALKYLKYPYDKPQIKSIRTQESTLSSHYSKPQLPNWEEVLSTTVASDSGKLPIPSLPLKYKVKEEAVKPEEEKKPVSISFSGLPGKYTVPKPISSIPIGSTKSKSVSVNIGFDWGASTAKVVYSFAFGGNTDDPMCVKFDSYFNCEKGSEHFLPLSEVILYQNKLFISPNLHNPNIRPYRQRAFKAKIIATARNRKRDIESETYALFNISAVLAHTVSEIKKTARKLFRAEELKQVNIRFGTPVDNIKSDLGNTFNKLFSTAINIYDKYDFFSGNGVDISLIRSELLSLRQLDRPGWSMQLEPEVFAEITSFASSYQANSDYIAVIDIGSSTLDMAFYLRSWINRNLLSQSVAKVSDLGRTNCQIYIYNTTNGKSVSIKDADAGLNTQFDIDVGDFARYVCEILFRDNEQKDKHTVYYYLFGGGTNDPYMVDKVEEHLQNGTFMYSRTKRARYELKRGEHIPYVLKDVPQSLQIRYQVAIGLARSSRIHIPNTYHPDDFHIT